MDAPVPEKLDLVEDHGKLVIRRKWFGWHLIFLTIFCVVWDGFLFFWYSIAFSDPDSGLMMKLFPIGHLAVGVGLTYFVIAGYFNKTDIIIDPMYIEVKIYPIKWFGNKKIDITEIKQLYTTEKISNTKNGTTVRYQVSVVTNENKQKKLVGGLESREQGLFIEHKIEEILGIKSSVAV